jgi:tellurite resistance protein TerC
MAGRFHLLSYGLAVILMFIGVKMLIIDYYKIPVFLALGVVIGLLCASIVASLLIKPRSHS